MKSNKGKGLLGLLGLLGDTLDTGLRFQNQTVRADIDKDILNVLRNDEGTSL